MLCDIEVITTLFVRLIIVCACSREKRSLSISNHLQHSAFLLAFKSTCFASFFAHWSPSNSSCLKCLYLRNGPASLVLSMRAFALFSERA